MIRPLIYLLAIGIVPLIAGADQSTVKPKWEVYSCEYIDLKMDITLSGRCHRQDTEINGNFAYVLTWPSGNKVSVEYLARQSGNHIWKINGEKAAAIEIDREHLKGFSLDLNQFIEWQDNPEIEQQLYQ